jgi:hypothetical protein
MPSSGCVNRPPWVTLTFQNTGVDSWDYGGTVQLSYQVFYVGGVGPNAVTQAAPLVSNMVAVPASVVDPGGVVQLPFALPAAAFRGGQARYRIRFDLMDNGQTFANLAAAEGKSWPYLERELALYDCTSQLYAPLVMRSPVVSESSH